MDSISHKSNVFCNLNPESSEKHNHANYIEKINRFKNKNIKFEFPEPVKLEKTMDDIFKGKCEKQIGYTLRVGGRGSRIDDRHNWDSYMVNGKVKRLMPMEGKRMMGFPENYIFPVTDAQAMKQLGNAVAVPAITAYAKQIISTLKKYDKGK